jgi:ParB-like chromosome segregation protein Spo0J
MEIKTIRLEEIVPDEGNPRTQMGEIRQLADTIRKVGVLQPILVDALAGGRFRIISGHRRYAAAGLAELEEIPAVVRSDDAMTRAVVQAIENFQRAQLSPFEQADAIQRIIDQLDTKQNDPGFELGKDVQTHGHGREKSQVGSTSLEGSSPQALNQKSTVARFRKAIETSLTRERSQVRAASLLGISPQALNQKLTVGKIRPEIRKEIEACLAKDPNFPANESILLQLGRLKNLESQRMFWRRWQDLEVRNTLVARQLAAELEPTRPLRGAYRKRYLEEAVPMPNGTRLSIRWAEGTGRQAKDVIGEAIEALRNRLQVLMG